MYRYLNVFQSNIKTITSNCAIFSFDITMKLSSKINETAYNVHSIVYSLY